MSSETKAKDSASVVSPAQQVVAPQKSMVSTSTKTAVNSFISGGVGGMCLVAAGHPFDLVKVRLQTSNEYKSAWDCLSRTFAKDGVTGLYRGMMAPLLGVAPVYALVFWGYDQGKKIAVSYSGTDKNAPLTTGQILFAGGFSAIPTTILMTPMERIKVILQIQGQGGNAATYSGPLDALKGILRTSGVKGLYRGTVATLLRDVPGSVAYFGAYEFVKRALTPAGSKPENLNPLAVVVAGGFAGVANWVVAIPPDVLKTRLQTAPEGKYTGLRSVFFDLVRTEGYAALFKGLGPAMVRAFPANASAFLGVELAVKALNTVW